MSKDELSSDGDALELFTPLAFAADFDHQLFWAVDQAVGRFPAVGTLHLVKGLACLPHTFGKIIRRSAYHLVKSFDEMTLSRSTFIVDIGKSSLEGPVTEP